MVMTESHIKFNIKRYTLLGKTEDARHILRGLQNNEAFQHYLRRRTLRALPLVVGILLTSLACSAAVVLDRKSTRLNSSHTVISYAVFCLEKKNWGMSRAGSMGGMRHERSWTPSIRLAAD